MTIQIAPADEALPRWDLTNLYPGLDTPEFNVAFDDFKRQTRDLAAFLDQNHLSKSAPESTKPDAAQAANLLSELLDRLNNARRLGLTLRYYIFSFVSTDSYNAPAKRAMSQWDMVWADLQKHETRVKGWIGTISDLLPEIIAQNEVARQHAFYLNEAAEQSQYLMSDVEESLAAELATSGLNAWGRLQGNLTSQVRVDFEMDGKIRTMPITELLNLRNHPDGDVRRRAYNKELETWASLREPLAAALNGVKGAIATVDRRRGRQDALHDSIDQARIDRQTLEAMLDAMQESFLAFHAYFQSKAEKLGKKQLPWWDLFAPLGDTARTYTYAEATDFIIENFAAFSPELADFARHAIQNHWIDVGPRDGKRAGAFCMLNFDGSIDSVSTMAHELGHGFHNYCLREATQLQRITPMTLAETASIMCQTIITDASSAGADDEGEELAILENNLSDAAQVIVDIYSRYLFEKEVFERRAEAELSAEEFCEIMLRAQQETYGDGLDQRHLHPYMWTWKPHYYRPELSFYNYPYAFGLLFGTGLYAIYQRRGDDFVPAYKDLLASTGRADAADLAARFDIDIRSPQFWRDSLAIITSRIDRYKEL